MGEGRGRRGLRHRCGRDARPHRRVRVREDDHVQADPARRRRRPRGRSPSRAGTSPGSAARSSWRTAGPCRWCSRIRSARSARACACRTSSPSRWRSTPISRAPRSASASARCSSWSGSQPDVAPLFPHEFSGGQRQRDRHRAGAGDRHPAHRAGRAGLGARRVGAGADHQPARAPAADARRELPLHRPRPGHGGAHQPSDRGDVPGPDRRDGGRATRCARARCTPTPRRCSPPRCRRIPTTRRRSGRRRRGPERAQPADRAAASIRAARPRCRSARRSSRSCSRATAAARSPATSTETLARRVTRVPRSRGRLGGGACRHGSRVSLVSVRVVPPPGGWPGSRAAAGSPRCSCRRTSCSGCSPASWLTSIGGARRTSQTSPKARFSMGPVWRYTTPAISAAGRLTRRPFGDCPGFRRPRPQTRPAPGQRRVGAAGQGRGRLHRAVRRTGSPTARTPTVITSMRR